VPRQGHTRPAAVTHARRWLGRMHTPRGDSAGSAGRERVGIGSGQDCVDIALLAARQESHTNEDQKRLIL